MRWPFLVRYSSNSVTLYTLHMDFASNMLDMNEHTKNRFIIGLYVCKSLSKENLTAHSSIFITVNN